MFVLFYIDFYTFFVETFRLNILPCCLNRKCHCFYNPKLKCRRPFLQVKGALIKFRFTGKNVQIYKTDQLEGYICITKGFTGRLLKTARISQCVF